MVVNEGHGTVIISCFKVPLGAWWVGPTWAFRECHRSVGWDEAGAIVQVVGSLSLMV